MKSTATTTGRERTAGTRVWHSERDGMSKHNHLHENSDNSFVHFFVERKLARRFICGDTSVPPVFYIFLRIHRIISFIFSFWNMLKQGYLAKELNWENFILYIFFNKVVILIRIRLNISFLEICQLIRLFKLAKWYNNDLFINHTVILI